MRKIRTCMIAATLFISSSAIFSTTASAHTVNEVNEKINQLEQEKNDLQNKQGNVSNNKQNADQKIGENLTEQSVVEKELNTLDEKLSITIGDINKKENEIIETNNQLNALATQIENLKKEIKVLERRIKERESLLKGRLQSIQKTGGSIQYMEVILGAQSFSEFISRSTAVNTIMDQDKTIMDDHIADKKELENKEKELEAKRVEVESKKAALENQKTELVALKATLDQQTAEKAALKSQLEKEHEELEEYKVSLEDEQSILDAQADAVKKAIDLAQTEKGNLERQAEQARLAKIEAEQRAKEAASAARSKASSSSNSSSSSGSSSNESKENTNSLPDESFIAPSGGGMFNKPAAGSYSSGYGYRWGSLHAGVDIANSIGTPVTAAASGVVISTNTEFDGRMNGYGNVILVAHSINGTTYTTLYAHLSSMSVSAGQAVGAGQVIGAIGNTGQSTGPHLHFEIHHGGWNGAKSNSVNPMTLLN